MVKQPDIDEVLAYVLRDPKNTTDFLLGTICTKVSTIEERQATVIEDVENLKKQSWFIRGAIAVGSLLGGGVGAKIAAALGALH